MTMGTDWRVEERLREKLALLSQELSETRAALDAVRADLAASEKAREEADAYAGRANARIADLGERLDATEAVLRDAEKAREEAEERLTLKRREYDIEVEVHAATKRERDSYIKGYEAAESRAARLEEKVRRIESACGLPDPAEACRVVLAIAAEEGGGVAVGEIISSADVQTISTQNAALRAEVERLKKALGYITDISEANADRAIVEMKRIAHEALDSAPADEEGRDE